MEEFQAELERNPEADLLSMVPDLYRHEHRNSQYLRLSHAAKINLRTLHDLCEILRDNPEENLLSIFPKNYNRKISMATGPKILPSTKKDITEEGPEFQIRLDTAETAQVIFLLSSTVTALITMYS